MRAAGPSVIVPSPAVIRFLKIQAESLSFLSDRTCATRAKDATLQRRGYCYWSRKRGDLGNIGGQTRRGIRFGGQSSGGRAGAGPSILQRRGLNGLSTPRDGPLPSFSFTNPPHRTFATALRNAARDWRWYRGQKTGAKPAPGSDIPPSPISGFLEDSASLSRIVKPTNDLKLRCTEFDEKGDVTLVNGEFKKSELIAKVSLSPIPDRRTIRSWRRRSRAWEKRREKIGLSNTILTPPPSTASSPATSEKSTPPASPTS